MNKALAIILFCICIPFFTFAQRSNKKGNTISISSSINYYPRVTPYSFLSHYTTQSNDRLILEYLTNNSGTFVVEESDSFFVERNNINEFPAQILGFGLGLRIMNNKALFHEISLTKLATVKSSNIIRYLYTNERTQSTFPRTIGYNQRTSTFAFRYEIGKYFRYNKKNVFNFALSGGIEPSFYFYKRTSYSINEHPIKAKIFSVDVSLTSIFSLKLSKKIFLDFKPTAFILLGVSDSVEEENPILPVGQRQGEREVNVPEISIALSLQLRYNIKEPKRRRRR